MLTSSRADGLYSFCHSNRPVANEGVLALDTALVSKTLPQLQSDSDVTLHAHSPSVEKLLFSWVRAVSLWKVVTTDALLTSWTQTSWNSWKCFWHLNILCSYHNYILLPDRHQRFLANQNTCRWMSGNGIWGGVSCFQYNHICIWETSAYKFLPSVPHKFRTVKPKCFYLP